MIKTNKNQLNKYKFIDLFAGIGGFYLALHSFGAKCVFTSEWDKYATETYQNNFSIKPFGDITKIDEKKIPLHNILCAGFPCQAFSIAGKQKGFEDIRGTLFFDIIRIVNYHKPQVLFLENVKNLAKHNNGNTLKIIIKSLEKIGYSIFTKVLNSGHFGLPQNRERIYIVAFHNSIDAQYFNFPIPTNEPISLQQFLEKEPKNIKIIERNDIEIYKNNISLLDFEMLNKPIQIGKINKGRQGERIYSPLGHAITLSAYGGGIGSKTGLYYIDEKIRKLSLRECARIQGFRDEFIINANKTQAYKQFGNSVSVNVLQYIMVEINKILELNEAKNSKNSN